MTGLRLAGRWSGRNLLEWPLGRFRERSGDGYSEVIPPAGVEVLAGTRASDSASGPDRGGFHPGLGHLPIAGQVTYRYDGDGVEFSDGRFSTPATDVTFSGRTAWGDDSRIPFHVTSADLQESDRVLAGMMTAFGAPTNADHGRRLCRVLRRHDRVDRPPARRRALRRARICARSTSTGEAAKPASSSRIRTSDVTGGRMQKDGGEIVVNGRFSLGFPRRDKGEEINGRIRVTRWTAADFKHAFDIDDYDVEGDRVGRVSPVRPLSGAVRLRHAHDRQRHRVRRAVRDRVGIAAVRRQRRAHRQHPDAEERRAPPKARRSSAGTAPTRSTRPAAASRWRASRRRRIRRRR